MNVVPLDLPGLLLIEPRSHRDNRGTFFELWHETRYAELGLPPFVQDNVAHSTRAVTRGMHFQHPFPQGKLVSILAGIVFDVAVDIRPASPAFGRWEGVLLDADKPVQLYIPPGFAHGYQVLSPAATVTYKCTALYHPEAEGTLLWDDPDVGIVWPLEGAIVSDKDRAGLPLHALPSRIATS